MAKSFAVKRSPSSRGCAGPDKVRSGPGARCRPKRAAGLWPAAGPRRTSQAGFRSSSRRRFGQEDTRIAQLPGLLRAKEGAGGGIGLDLPRDFTCTFD